MATENILMAAVARGGDRQELHEHIRQHSHAVTAKIKDGSGSSRELIDRIQNDAAFSALNLSQLLQPGNFVGRAPQQVDEFLVSEVEPIRRCYRTAPSVRADISV
jgi:adenylosuccinate lyase